MCGRYALGIRASFVRWQFQQQGMRVDDAPEDEEARETYNFPPGAYGLVYRPEVPDNGLREEEEEVPPYPESYNFQLKVMKWGLIPFWTKRSPDYGSMIRTINCRDDSLIENRGMWTTMKLRKRCIVVAQGFFEWLKKGPKEKVPHFVKRKDGQLMCFAGLWDCVKYEDTEDKLYSYTIITTDANKQLTFLHDRMPVILDPNSEAMTTWLDPTRRKWTKDLQSLLKPYEGELECYPVTQEVGKVGNNSPNFIIPVDSKENKKNIANFFGTKKESQETRKTEDHDGTENHAPIPVPTKRKLEDEGGSEAKIRKVEPTTTPKKPSTTEAGAEASPVRNPDHKVEFHDSATNTEAKTTKPPKAPSPVKKAKSATHNEGFKKASPVKTPGSQRITNFFGKT